MFVCVFARWFCAFYVVFDNVAPRKTLDECAQVYLTSLRGREHWKSKDVRSIAERRKQKKKPITEDLLGFGQRQHKDVIGNGDAFEKTEKIVISSLGLIRWAENEKGRIFFCFASFVRESVCVRVRVCFFDVWVPARLHLGMCRRGSLFVSVGVGFVVCVCVARWRFSVCVCVGVVRGVFRCGSRSFVGEGVSVCVCGCWSVCCDFWREAVGLVVCTCAWWHVYVHVCVGARCCVLGRRCSHFVCVRILLVSLHRLVFARVIHACVRIELFFP